MKINKSKKSAALLSFLGLIQASTGYAAHRSFIPLENLSPEQRITLGEKINYLAKDKGINWNDTTVGVDSEGNILFVPKLQSGLNNLANPSTYGSFTQSPDEE